MADKEIVDGACATIIIELDDAAEARIIDVLSKVFVTNKYPGLRAAILDGAERYKQQKEMEDGQRQYEWVNKYRSREQAALKLEEDRIAMKQNAGGGLMNNQIEEDRIAMKQNAGGGLMNNQMKKHKAASKPAKIPYGWLKNFW